MKVMIFDNGGETLDRFTLVNKKGACYGFSEKPFHPLGFGQYCGEVTVPYVKIGESLPNLGKRISKKELNEDCRIFVNERI